MCRRASVDLAPDRISASLAREWVISLCVQWDLMDICDDLSLATSELVTNAVLHARTPITVDLLVAEAVVEVQVRDLDAALPTVLPVREDLNADIGQLIGSFHGPDNDDLRHESWVVGSSGSIAAGRGLQLLEAITDCWGVAVLADRPGKVVWFSLSVPHTMAACRCGQGDGQSATGRAFHGVGDPLASSGLNRGPR